jgi:hypothetical protein
VTTTVGRALVFVTTGPGVDVDTLERAVVAACDDIHGRLVDGGTVRAGVRLDDDPLAAIAREREIRPIQAVVEVSVPEPGGFTNVSAALDGFVAAMGDVMDVDASFVVAGPCHLLADRSGPVMLGSTGKRRADKTRAEFSDWWLTHHGPMSIQLVPGSVGYQQTHVDPDASQMVADACGLTTRDHDLGETAYFNALEDFLEPLSDPEIGKTLFEDEARFVDHSSMIATMARRVVDR